MMFCTIDELKTESDVEQKLLWHVLTKPSPQGLGFSSVEVMTKLSIRRLEIGKRESRRLYFPDYIVLLAGLPVLVVEAKPPTDTSLDAALDEARMYAAKLNELFPAGVNPCMRVLASNGSRMASTAWDSATIDADVTLEQISVSDLKYAALCETLSRATLQQRADQLLRQLSRHPLKRPVNQIGGQSVRNEEIGHNTFGSTLALDFRHIFSPSTLEDRAYLVRNAYVRSVRRERYVEPIDRLIREIITPGVSHIKSLEDSWAPKELTSILGRGRSLEHQIMLLVGSVGSGKSTFVDYLVNVALPRELIAQTVWLRLDMNLAPLQKDMAHDWLLSRIVEELKASDPSTDFDELASLQKVYAPELNRLKKGALALLDENSIEYRQRLADEIISLQKSILGTARALSRYLCTERRKLLVIVLDNCDKRVRDDQLLMFQLAHWTQNELRCLVVLPIRDITFNLHKNEPPLDTAQKDLVFRIEPPRFTEVLSSRVALALEEMGRRAKDSALSYTLPNGIKVTYPASDQGMYLACILRSLYEYDRFLRRLLTGLAGRDVRRALEMFLEFCSSGHISEAEIFKIRQYKGDHTLPLSVVSRVLLRMNRRFYDGDSSYLKNLLQCDPSDSHPDHFARLAILKFLDARIRVKGPSGVKGFHRCTDIIQRLVVLGHAAERVREELLYLLAAGCIIAEHQRTDKLADEDLVCLSSSGSVHLDVLGNLDYLAACAEDTWFADQRAADRVTGRIGQGRGAHFSDITIFQNADEFVSYVTQQQKQPISAPSGFLNDDIIENLHDLSAAISAVATAKRQREALRKSGRIFIGNLPFDTTEVELMEFLAINKIALIDIFLQKEKGIAFVSISQVDLVDEIISKLDGANFQRRRLKVSHATERTRKHGAAGT